jgi:hypothetical protein
VKLSILEFPADKEAKVRRYADPLLTLVPSWVNDLAIINRPTENDDGTLAEIHCTPAYHRATIKLYLNFWEEPESDQQDALRHEFCHLATAPLALCAEQMLDSFYKEGERGPAHAFMKKTLADAIENVTEELCQLWGAKP